MKGNFKTIVMQPKYTDIMEWVAVNSAWPVILSKKHRLISCAVFDFYQNLNQFYGVLAECCTSQSCPTMSAGPQYAVTILTRTHCLT